MQKEPLRVHVDNGVKSELGKWKPNQTRISTPLALISGWAAATNGGGAAKDWWGAAENQEGAGKADTWGAKDHPWEEQCAAQDLLLYLKLDTHMHGVFYVVGPHSFIWFQFVFVLFFISIFLFFIYLSLFFFLSHYYYHILYLFFRILFFTGYVSAMHVCDWLNW